eukprot:TRINITY_DN15339_c0_g1_i2.p1 TRINITY_DN15339_c0_g1~~TRINITY_DN15339_c0_g1_i2.p1  ORF type:complete len:698 (+),score=187.27 TRINITY_DN15339_c0_g1_i2:93-2096(+)
MQTPEEAAVLKILLQSVPEYSPPPLPSGPQRKYLLHLREGEASLGLKADDKFGVAEVIPNTAASRAGVPPGGVITSVGDTLISGKWSKADFADLIIGRQAVALGITGAAGAQQQPAADRNAENWKRFKDTQGITQTSVDGVPPVRAQAVRKASDGQEAPAAREVAGDIGPDDGGGHDDDKRAAPVAVDVDAEDEAEGDQAAAAGEASGDDDELCAALNSGGGAPAAQGDSNTLVVDMSGTDGKLGTKWMGTKMTGVLDGPVRRAGGQAFVGRKVVAVNGKKVTTPADIGAAIKGSPVVTFAFEPFGLNVSFSRALVSRFIGPKGRNISQIRAESGAEVKLDEQERGDSVTARITGDPGKASAAEALIRDWLENNGQEGCITVPTGTVGLILGSKGSNIKQMTAQSGADIKVPQHHTGATTEIRIYGSAEAVAQAQTLVKELIDSSRLKQNTGTVSVPPEAQGFLIGAQGSRVQELQRQSGANISITRSVDAVLCTGTAEAVAKAKVLIAEAVAEWRKREGAQGEGGAGVSAGAAAVAPRGRGRGATPVGRGRAAALDAAGRAPPPQPQPKRPRTDAGGQPAAAASAPAAAAPAAVPRKPAPKQARSRGLIDQAQQAREGAGAAVPPPVTPPPTSPAATGAPQSGGTAGGGKRKVIKRVIKKVVKKAA